MLAIIGNEKGGLIASQYQKISYIGYPHSISELFLKFNINSSIEKSRKTLENLLNACTKCQQKLIVYFSMAFGNPYGDAWNIDLILSSLERMKGMGIQTISLSDTIGMATPESTEKIFSIVMKEFPDMEIGFHLHTTPRTWKEKVAKAYENGCRRFDSVINGLGGCPMAKHELVGNLDTSNLLLYLNENNIEHNINLEKYLEAQEMASSVFKFTYSGF